MDTISVFLPKFRALFLMFKKGYARSRPLPKSRAWWHSPSLFIFNFERTCAYQGVRMFVCISGSMKYSFFRKFGVLCFLETPILKFVLLPYYRPFRSQVKDRAFRQKQITAKSIDAPLLKTSSYFQKIICKLCTLDTCCVI